MMMLPWQQSEFLKNICDWEENMGSSSSTDQAIQNGLKNQWSNETLINSTF